MIEFLVLAQAQEAPPGSALGAFVPIILIFIIFYFLLIRPQMKKQKEHQKMVSELKTGDKVVTSGGIYGLITNVRDTTVTLKIAENVKIELDRTSVGAIIKSSDSGDQK